MRTERRLTSGATPTRRETESWVGPAVTIVPGNSMNTPPYSPDRASSMTLSPHSAMDFASASGMQVLRPARARDARAAAGTLE